MTSTDVHSDVRGERAAGVDLATLAARYELRRLRAEARGVSLVDAVERRTGLPRILWVPTRVDARAFRARVERMRGWRHPCHAEVCALEHAADGAPFAVLAHVPGESLARAFSPPYRLDEALAAGRALGDALVAAHAAGVAHGLLDPAFVLLHDGRCTLLGAGLGDVDDPAEDQAALAALVARLIAGASGSGPALASPPRTPTPPPATIVLPDAQTAPQAVGRAPALPPPIRIVRVAGVVSPVVAAGAEPRAADVRDAATALIGRHPGDAAPGVDTGARDGDDERTALLPKLPPLAAPTAPAPAAPHRQNGSLLFGVGARTREETTMRPLPWSPPAADAAAVAKQWRGDVERPHKRRKSRGLALPLLIGAAVGVLIVAGGALALSGKRRAAVAEAGAPTAAPAADTGAGTGAHAVVVVDRAAERAWQEALDATNDALHRQGIERGDVDAVDAQITAATRLAGGKRFREAIDALAPVSALAKHVRVDGAFVEKKLARLAVYGGPGFDMVKSDVAAMMSARHYDDANRRINQWVLAQGRR